MEYPTVSSLLREVVATDESIRWSSLMYIVIGLLFFVINNRILLRRALPTSVRSRTSHHMWRWRNVTNSFIHSCITGIGAIFSFWAAPKMAEDLIRTHCALSHILVCISMGYFVFDFADLAIHNRKRSAYELLLHHTLVLMCFGISAFTQFYVGFAMAALLAEINSIFLHARQMMQIQGYQRDHILYKTNSLINIGTFVAFRIILFSWMTRWLVINRDAVTLISYTIGCVGLATIVVMNIILFLRILNADFKKQFEKREGMMKLLEEDQLNRHTKRTD